MSELVSLFYRGQFERLLEQTIETPGATWARGQAHYVIGALAFRGRVDDGLVLLRKHAAALDATGLAAARFFCGIGLVRVSRFDEGRRFLAENLASVRRAPLPPTARFYAYQGLAFYRFFQNRYGRALVAAKLAWEAALEADYPYGQSLSADMRAHALVRTGAIAAGLREFDAVARLCERHALGMTAASVATAQFYYRAQHGLLGDDAIPALERFVASFAPEDNFSLAVAQMTLAHQLALRGRVRRSESLLAEAARVLLKAGHRRQKAMIRQKLALNRSYMGRHDEALELLDAAKAELDLRFDLDQHLEIAGFQLKIGRALGWEPARTAPLEQLVRRLTPRVGSGHGRNVLWRDLDAGAPTLRGDDLLGDARHLCRRGEGTPYVDVLRLVDEGYLGFLHDVLPRASERRVVCFDLLPQRVTVIDEGEVVISDEPVSSALKAVALQIFRAPATKKDLIEAHWGFVYHALRHDPLVYAVINRLRKALGGAAEWLQFEDGAYGFVPGVRVYTYEPQGLALPAAASQQIRPESVVWAPGPDEADGDLNHRQVAILSELGRRSHFNVQDCVELFGISRITAFRDLGGLTKRGLLRRRGKGRATTYHR